MKQLERCPKCGCVDYVDDREDFELDGILKVVMKCADCGYTWIEVYKFMHNEDADTHELIIESEE